MKLSRILLYSAMAGACIILLFFFLSKKKSVELTSLHTKKNLVPVVILGAGPAGLSAAIFTSRAQYKTVIVAGPMMGGQIAQAAYVENWPGIQGKDTGLNTIEHVKKQVEHFGATIIEDSATTVNLHEWPYEITLSDGTQLHALTIIIAMGGSQKTLNIAGVKEYWGKGIGVCSICDAPFDKDKDVAIIGGGDSAADKALQSAAYAKSVTILVKNNEMHAAAVIQDYLKTMPNITIRYGIDPVAIVGDGQEITGLTIKDTKANKEEQLSIQRVYFALGFEPNSTLFKDALVMDNDGYLVTYNKTQKTSKEGVFAAGNIEDDRYQKGSVASGKGVSAAIDAIEWLQSIGFTATVQQKYGEQLYKINKTE